MKILKIIAGIIFSLGFISYTLCQPERIPNIIASYTPRHGGYVEVPDRIGNRAETGWIWHLIADVDSDGLDIPQLAENEIGMPFDDDSLLCTGSLGDGKYAHDSLLTCAAFATVDSNLWGVPVYFRIFGADSLAPGIPFTQTLDNSSLLSSLFMELKSLSLMPYGHGGIMESWLSLEGIPLIKDYGFNNPESNRDSVIINDRAFAVFSGDEGHGLIFHDVCLFSGQPPTWNMNAPSLDFSLTVSVDFINNEPINEIRHELNILFDEDEIELLYGETSSPQDFRIWLESDSGWVSLQTNVSIYNETEWRAEFRLLSPPLSGRFVLAPEGLNPLLREERASITEYKLHPAYPNPFNPTTRLSLDLLDESFTKIEVFNILGRRVSVLFRGKLPAGRHLITFDAARFSSGVYFIKADAGVYHGLQKVMVLR
ncbi:MAG: T9SS type A sorting domain-containing protein [Candidatus Electryonea clarkiae]|nr:T9SS type A sorting domain-containing protein [Candidatus Electryonea clarkiae]MDP8287100.1 T9SS type A sorting domain-containing protein [Candidatus Electryonea clarkiae]